MSQLTQAPLQSAKHLKKLKEIKQVETAIKWHERARKKRQALAGDRYEAKMVAVQKLKWEKRNIIRPKRAVIRKAREDYLLGPLRPNRAFGQYGEKYGLMTSDMLRRPNIPVKVHKQRREIQEKKGWEVEYPLVVGDKKYFPIVEGDRVVVMKGREKGKIGVVSDVIEPSHEVVIQGINTVYADGNIFNTPKGEKKEAKREIDAPVPFADVRLVVPYRALVPYKVTTTDAYGYTKEVTKTREVVQDVVVDKLVMERHTTGVDPFTNVDYGKDEFPEEHRFYPETGLPIFKRYIAGTQEHIQWPWEFNEEEYKNSVSRNEALLENPAKDADAPSEKPKGRLGRSIDWVKDKTTATKAALSSQAQADLAAEKARARDERDAAAFKNALEKASEQSYPAKEDPQLPSDGAEDTSRNLAEVSAQSRSFYPTLMYPPFPNELADELAADIRVKARADAKDKSDVETMEERKRERARKYEEAEEAKAREEAIRQQVMLTPMQLRWELERERKLREEKPLVQKDVLLAALGMHMSAKGVRLTEKRMRAAESANVD